MHKTRRKRFAVVVVLVAVFASAAYAFTAANVVPGSSAGDGSGAISGYTVSNVAYTLNATNPQNIDQVAFTLAPAAAGTVKMKLAAAGNWYTCANAAGSVTCNTTSPQATVSGASQLTVVAVQ